MAISSGTRLGPYEVVAPLGSGGMGEVWKARDTRLERSVAIKVLPAEFAQNAQLKLRFEREAKTISQLNHPHICTLYDVGEGYLVMELLEGESLADRVTKGPLPLQQVLRYGIETASALDKAHKAGIIHRDLKPGNVMITKSGAKLLDFGLARDASTAPLAGTTVQKPLTEEGTILGTFQYMAPEQLEGLPADARTDIFALGAVLYEMATGKRAFEGKSKASLIANIMGGEPKPISAIQPATPAALDRVIRICLEKDPDERWQSAHDVAIELRAIGEAAATTAKQKSRTPWIAAAVLAIAAIVLGALYVRSQKPQQLMVTEIAAPPVRFAFNPQISADGTKIVFPVADENGNRSLMLRSLDSNEYSRIEGSEGGFAPFWSPDSRTLYFENRGGISRIAINGGTVEKVADFGGVVHGATVSQDGIVLASRGNEIIRVDRSGRQSVVSRRRADELWREFPYFLPDGQHFLYWARAAGERGEATIRIGSLDGNVDKVLTQSDSRAMYVRPGYILYATANHVVAQKFNDGKLELEGDPVVLGSSVAMQAVPGAIFSASNTGLFLYRMATAAGNSQLTWFDAAGHQVDSLAPPQGYWDIALSHDGRHLAVRIENIGGIGHLWIYDLERKLPTRFTAGDDDEAAPIWSSDDQTIFFTSSNSSEWRLYRRGVASQQATLLSRSAQREYFTSISPDGRFALIQTVRAAIGAAPQYVISLMSLTDGKRTPLGDSRFTTMSAKFSPDGKWIAYSSDESNRAEIYVERFPGGGEKTRISADGGRQPIWSHDGKTLYFQQADEKIMAVDLPLGSTVEPGTPRVITTAQTKPGPNQQFDVAPDGKILANLQIADDNVPYTLIQNWTAKLK